MPTFTVSKKNIESFIIFLICTENSDPCPSENAFKMKILKKKLKTSYSYLVLLVICMKYEMKTQKHPTPVIQDDASPTRKIHHHMIETTMRQIASRSRIIYQTTKSNQQIAKTCSIKSPQTPAIYVIIFCDQHWRELRTTMA